MPASFARLMLVTTLTLNLSGLPGAAEAAGSSAGGPLVGELIVKFGDAVEAPAALTRLEAALGLAAGGLRLARRMLNGAQVVDLPQAVPPAEAQRLAARLAAQPSVAYAFPNFIRRPLLTPDDPAYNQQWHLFDPAGGIDAPAAWDITIGTSNVVVAIVDTGVLTGHPDLPAGRMLPGYDFVSDPFTANDGDGRDGNPADPGDWVTAADIANALGLCAGYPKATHSSWHGTHVAGLVAAEGDNGQLTAGVAWGVSVLPVRALGKCGGTDADIADAMLWAAGLAPADPDVPANPRPAQIINLSLGGGGPCSLSIYQTVIDQITAAGKLVVAAAGNDGGAVYTPADCEGVLAVAANNRAGDLSNFSSHGPEIALSAPGGQSSVDYIWSSFNSGTTTPGAATYAGYTGTSAAAPQVAAAAALMLSVNPLLTPAQVTAVLTSTTRPFVEGGRCLTDPGLAGQCGWGRLNAGAAVSATLAALPAVDALAPGSVLPGSSAFTLTVTGRNFVDGAQVLWNDAPLTTTFLSPAALTAAVPGSAVTTVGSAQIKVANPGLGGVSFHPRLFVVGARALLPLIQRAP